MSANKIIEEQLKKVEYADLSNFDAEKNIYIIPKRVDIKVEVDKCYLIQILPELFNDSALKVNWNNGSIPKHTYMKIDVSKILGKTLKVVGTGFDITMQKDISDFWSGYLPLKYIKVIKKL